MIAGLNDVETLVSRLNLGPQLLIAVLTSAIYLDAIRILEGLSRKIRAIDTPGPDVQRLVICSPNTTRWE